MIEINSKESKENSGKASLFSYGNEEKTGESAKNTQSYEELLVLYKKIEPKVTKLEEAYKDQQKTVIEIIGIFVALFTFISIDINIFRLPLNVWELVGFIFITLSSLSFFILLLDIILITSSIDATIFNLSIKSPNVLGFTFNFILFIVSLIRNYIKILFFV
jgi:hypothetical protein